MPVQLHAPWRNANSATKFPFNDDAVLTSGELTLPDGAFVDASIYVPGAVAPFYLSSVTIGSEEVELVISDSATGEIAWGTFSTVAPTELIAFNNERGYPAGVMVGDTDVLLEMQTKPTGTYAFRAGQAELTAVCCIPLPVDSVQGFVLDDGTVLAGDVYLIGEDGVVLTHVQTPSQISCGAVELFEAIRIDVVGDPLFKQKACEDGGRTYVAPRLIKSVRFLKDSDPPVTITPDDRGDIQIFTADVLVDRSALRIHTTADGIMFELVGKSNFG